MSELEEEFHFTYDAYPFPRPAGFDGLKEDWGQRTYANPPFRGPIVVWARKAVLEASKGKGIVLILPTSRVDHATDILLDAGARARVIKSVSWIDPAGNRTSRPSPCILFILNLDGVK